MKTLVAMSGGVDSSVAAWMIKTAYGRDNVWGVHMLLNEDLESCDLKSRSCCGTQDAEDARKVAQHLGIMFDAIPMYDAFQQAVVDNFVSEYAAGRTPIPCTHCNGVLKFNLLLKYADVAGYDRIATGHYVGQDLDGRLWRAQATEKDQSYYLWQIKAEALPRLVFPIGALSGKEECRKLAIHAGLEISQKPDSQNICFVPAGDYRKVLESKRPDLFTSRQGKIVVDGKVVGEHEGYWGYTIGQRVRLPGLSERLYVIGVVAATNTIITSPNPQATLTSSFAIQDPNWHDGKEFHKGEYWIKTSAHAEPVAATLLGARVFTKTPVKAAPGQACVFYRPGSQNKGFKLEGGAWIR